MFDIIIVGAGPAGMTAALYALRANKKILIFEANTYGGQIVKANIIENYPAISKISGYDFATNLYNQIKNMGATIKYETVIKITKEKEVITNKGTYQATSIILATGADNRKLNIEGEANLIGRGVSYCATCDGNLYKDKVVAVAGGGNVALQDALYLSDIAKKVYLIHRRDTFRGDTKYVFDIEKKDNIEIIYNSNVTKINGKDKVESIIVTSSDNSTTFDVDALFVAVGQEPKNSMFADVIKLNEYGYIESVDGIHTNVDGIYVAGDCRVKILRQLTTAVSDGSVAATVAMKEMR